MTQKKPALLEGIRVADLTTVFFGPYCTATLADLGADVIKLEPQDGDTARMIGNPPNTSGMGPVFMRLNRGKRSVDWDLKSPAGRDAFMTLLGKMDVFIHNIRRDAIDRLGFGYEEVRKVRPDIIYVHCSGFDQQGPYADLQAYDDIIQAASGLTQLLPMVDGNPQPRYLPTAVADKVSGLHAAYGVLAAVIHKLRTGEGQYVEVPMFESMVSFNTLEHLCDNTYVPPTEGPSTIGPGKSNGYYQRQLDPTRQPMRTRDGWVAFAPYLDDRWVRFFEAAGHGHVLKEPRFIDKATRRANMSQMFELMATIAPERTTEEWLALMKTANVPAMRVNRIDELPTNAQLQASGLMYETEHPTEGRYIEVGQPVRFSAAERDGAALRPAASVGQHTAEIEHELGITPVRRPE
ncbi:MAG: CoA transferase [Chromatiales bacterium]|nr:CoA transferase [Chromatiales bacterium]